MDPAWQDKIRENTGVDVSGDPEDPRRLWVPMQLQALVFGTEGTAKFLDLTPYYRGLIRNTRAAPLGYQLKRDIFNFTNPPEPGVHLHWTLPAAFTHVRPAAANHGTPPEDDGAPPELPLAPNRWVVVRLWEKGAKLQHKSWVVDSDFRGREAVSDWLEAKGGAYEITKLGRWQLIEDWARPQPAATPLTAFAPGNLAFAAFYPSCRGVFGFHDKAADLVEGTVYSYLVAGWFADRAADPLNVRKPRPAEEQEEARLKRQLTEQEEARLKRKLTEQEEAQLNRKLTGTERWLRRMGQLQWAIPGDSSVLPTALTCYGVMSHILWTTNKPCDGLDRPRVTVTLGSSVTEAAAALATRTGDSERLLSELQYATLAERRPSYEEAKAENLFKILSRMLGACARVHDRAFSPRDGGLSWEIVQQEDGAKVEDASAQPIPRLTKDIAARLHELNRRQREYDEITRTLAGWQRRLFAVWYQHQYQNSTAVAQPATVQENELLLKEIATCKGHVDGALTDRGTKETAVKTAKSGLETALGKDMPKASLVARAMPRFWRANDPFVLMGGLEVPAMQGGASPLQCRVSDRVIAGIKLGNVPNIGTIEIKRADLRAGQNWDKLWSAGVPPAVSADIPKDIEELLFDALFADPDRAELLARVYLRPQHGDNPPADRLDSCKRAIAAALIDIKKAAADKMLEIEGVQPTALDSLISAINRPSPSNLPTPTSWRPVFMRWRLGWYPYYQEKDLSRSTAHWDFTWNETGRVDYQWKGPPKPNDSEARNFDGFTVIAANIERGLKLTSENFSEYKDVFEQMTRPLLGQSLMGLTEALGMRDTGPQLPPLKKPLGARPLGTGDLTVDDDIAKRVDHHYAAAPLSKLPFSPLRGGLFSLLHLSIVDSFGRVLIIHDKDSAPTSNPPKLGRTLRGPPPEDGFALLPPRLVQPARLLLRWLSAWSDDQESLGDLETNPICGFIIHNRLDSSLLVYGTSNDEQVIYGTGNGGQAAVGRLLGAVQTVQYISRPGRVRWSTMAMRPFTGPAPTERVLTDVDIPNPHLRNFVNGLLKLTGGALGTPFQTFLDLLERREEAAELSVDQGLQSILTGRPLALVRASLRLELEGPPLRDETAIPSEQAPAYLSVKFPVRLGDRRLGPDGLVGYFVDDGAGTAYDQLRLSADEESYQKDEAHRYFHDQRDLEVACDPAAGPINLTLLLDPNPGLHVVSGVLPADRVRLPQPLVAATLSDLEMPFLVAPFLGEQVSDPKLARRMPLPTNGHKEWTWKFFDDAHEEPQEVDAQVETESAPSLFTTMALYEGWLNYRPSRAKPNGGN
jgi:hypothetical protein